MIKKMHSFFLLLEKTSLSKKVYILLIFLASISSLLEVLPASLIGHISTIVSETSRPETYKIALWCLLFFSVVLIGALVRNWFCYFTSKCSNVLISDIRKVCFSKLLSVNFCKLEEADSGYLINMIQGNTARLEAVFSVALFTLVSDIFDLLWISVFIILIDWKFLAIMMAFMPLLYLEGIKSAKKQREFATDKIRIESKLISTIKEVFSNIAVIRVFAGQNREKEKFGQNADAYKIQSNKADAALSTFFVIEKVTRYIAITSVLFIAANGIIKGTYAVGSLVTIVLYSQKFYSPISNIIRYFQMIQSGMASIDEIGNFLDSQEISENENITFIPSKEFEAVIENVHVEMNGKTLLSSARIPLIDHTLNIITGESGSGKSTLLKAILGVYPLSEGTIQMYCAPLDFPLFSYASQDAEIFSGTVWDNVLYPQTQSTVSDSTLRKAKMIMEQLGFSAEHMAKWVGEGGSTLSGGERKRIAFARAVIRQSRILLLDEVTSNLDEHNKKAVVQMIVEESQRRCVVLVTHETLAGHIGANTYNIEKAIS